MGLQLPFIGPLFCASLIKSRCRSGFSRLRRAGTGLPVSAHFCCSGAPFLLLFSGLGCLYAEEERNKERRAAYERKFVAEYDHGSNTDSSPVTQDEYDGERDLSFTQVAAQSK